MSMDTLARGLCAAGIEVREVGRELHGVGAWDGLTIERLDHETVSVSWDGTEPDEGQTDIVDATVEAVSAAARALREGE